MFGGVQGSVWNDPVREFLEDFSSRQFEKVSDEGGTEFEVKGQILDYGSLWQRRTTCKLSLFRFALIDLHSSLALSTILNFWTLQFGQRRTQFISARCGVGG
jgi:hypothetical protein